MGKAMAFLVGIFPGSCGFLMKLGYHRSAKIECHKESSLSIYINNTHTYTNGFSRNLRFMALVVGNFSIAPWRRIRPFERARGGSRGCCSLCRSPRHPRRHGRSDADHLPHRAKGEGYRMGPLLDSVQLPTKSG